MGTSVLRFGNSGGNRLFGDAWNISSLITNGGANSSQYQIGDLVFSGRKATTDTTLTEAMRVTAGGNVGIGTASPVSALNVAGTTGLNWAANGTSLGLVTVGTPGTGGSFWINTPASSATYAAGLGVTGSYASLRSTVNINAYGPKFALYGSELAFSTTYGSALNEAMRIDESGNVGIGTNNPGYKLSVQGGNGNNPGISLTSGAANTGTFYGWGKAGASDGGLLGVAGVAENYWTYAAAGDTVLRAASGKLHLATNYNGSGLTLDTSGALLLGTTVLTPDQHGNVSKLLVHTAPNVNIGIGVSTVEPGVAWISAFDDPVLNNLPLRLNSSEFRFYNSDTRLATIQSSGNVGIGISSPSQKLEVNGGIKLNTTIAKPTCNSSTRGTFWFTQGATGTKDSVEVCAKNAAGTYAWRTIY
jgi:hypothetical protein